MKAKTPFAQLIPVVFLQLIAAVVLVDGGSFTAGSDPAPIPPPLAAAGSAAVDMPAAPPLVVHGTTDEWQAHLDDALESFADADMDLPPLDITFHDSRAGCEGYPGLFRMVDRVGKIEVCVPTKYMILHELGHAWVAHNSDDKTRSRLVEYWQLPTWNDQNVEWDMRANERAADSIAFALADLSPYVAQTRVDYLCAYTLLTGHVVHPTITSDCRETVAHNS